MELDRGVLARIDRKLLARLGQDATFHMVRVPAIAAKWATWKRYCDAAGLSMGRAILALIDRELVSVFGEMGDDEVPVFAAEAEEALATRETAIADREGRISAEEERLRDWGDRLRRWHDELRRREQQVELAARLAMRPKQPSPKIGRNERCPCSNTSIAMASPAGQVGSAECLRSQGVIATLRRVSLRVSSSRGFVEASR
jgi:hypothetical protein